MIRCSDSPRIREESKLKHKSFCPCGKEKRGLKEIIIFNTS